MIFIIVLLVLVLWIYLFLRQRKFGKYAAGERLQKIMASPNYRDGKFQNIHFTPDLKEGVKYVTVIREFLFNKSKRSKPSVVLPSKKTDLHTLPVDRNFIVWFGHSSYFLQLDGKKILVDPVFSGSASPVRFTTRSFKGSDVYSAEDMPLIDYLFITHDHWDHLDYETVLLLKPKIKSIVTGLGTGAHLEYWGFNKNMIIEKDWNEAVKLDPGFTVNTTSARHFSGRGIKRNPALWMSFVLTTPSMKIYIGGDSGYDNHFIDIGNSFGPFDLAILECGQYNEYWKYIHMMPEEVVKAAIELKAKTLFPVHWSKFSLSLHAWDEPINRVTFEAKKMQMPVIHPMIGEAADLQQNNGFEEWWKMID